MTGCANACPYEATVQDERSVGVIGDDEIIHRASFNPMHVKKGVVKNSFVKAVDLFNGELSVWRESLTSECTAEDIAEIIETPQNNAIWALHGAFALAIRSLTSPQDGQRLFCVVDETETDVQGGFHPAHAHIRLCDQQSSKMADTSAELFIHAKEQLCQLLAKSGIVWKRQDAAH